jgi:ABC-type phosphate transport system substrate-binding protein
MSVRHSLLVLLLSLGLGSITERAVADVVVVVSAKSPLKELSLDQLSGIFLGKIAVLPNGMRISPIDQSEGVATRDTFYTQYIGKSPTQVRAYWSKLIFSGRGQPPRSAHDDETVKRLLAEHPDWIGYIDRSALDGSVRPLSLQGKT